MEHQLANGQAAPSARHTTAAAPGGYEGAPVLAATPILVAAIRKKSVYRTPKNGGLERAPECQLDGPKRTLAPSGV
jgi:hypothetical protein